MTDELLTVLVTPPRLSPKMLGREDDPIQSFDKTIALGIICFSLLVDMIAYEMVVPIIPDILRTLNADERYIGALYSSYSMGYLITSPIVGTISDGLKKHIIILIATQLISILSSVLFLYSDGLSVLLASRVIQGMGAAITWTLGFSLITKLFSASKLGVAVGTANSLSTLGYLIGPILGGVLTQYFGFFAPFYVCMILALMDLMGRIYLLTLIPRTICASELSTTPRMPAFKAFLKNGNCIFMFSAVFLSSFTFSTVESLAASHAEKAFGCNTVETMLLFLSLVCTSVIFSFIGGHWSEKFCRYRLTFYGSVLCGFSLLLLPISPNQILFAGSNIIFGASNSILSASAIPEMTRIAEDMRFSSHHQIHALSNFLYALGMLVGSNFASLGSTSIQYEGALTLSSGICIPFIVIYWFISSRS